MALRHDRINIDVVGPSAAPKTTRNGADRVEKAVLIIAAHQIARQQFSRKIGLEHRAQKKRPTSEDA